MAKKVNFGINSYRANKQMKAANQPHYFKDNKTLVEYMHQNGNGKTYYGSKSGSNTGVKISTYATKKANAKGKFGAIVKTTSVKYVHGNSLADVFKKAGKMW